MNASRALLAALGLACCVALAQAEVTLDLPHAALPDSELSELRGGFIGARGVEIAFSFERFVLTDGELMLTQAIPTIQLPLLNRTTPAASLETNLFDATGLTLGGMGILVQNSMNHRTIQHLNLINLDVSGFQQLQYANIHSRLLPTAMPRLR